MTNPFNFYPVPLSGPFIDIVPVTPDDGTDLPFVGVGLYIQTGGTVTFITVAETTRTVTVADGSIIPVGVRRVMATGTTATGIHVYRAVS